MEGTVKEDGEKVVKRNKRRKRQLGLGKGKKGKASRPQ